MGSSPSDNSLLRIVAVTSSLLVLPLAAHVLGTSELAVLLFLSVLYVVLPGPLMIQGFLGGDPRWIGDAAKAQREFPVVFLLISALLCIFCLPIFVNPPALGGLLGGLSQVEIRLAALILASQLLFQFLTRVLPLAETPNELKLISKRRIQWFEAAQGLILLLALLLGRSLVSFLSAYALTGGIGLLICGRQLLRGIRFGSFKIRITAAVPFLQQCLPVSLFAALFLPALFADRLVLSQLVDLEDFANYSLGALIILPAVLWQRKRVALLQRRLQQPWIGDLSDRREAALVRGQIAELSLALVPAGMLLFIFAEQLSSSLFGTQYQEASKVLRLFAAGYVLLIFPFEAVPLSKNDFGWMCRSAGITFVVALCACSLAAIYGSPVYVALSLLFSLSLLVLGGIRRAANLLAVPASDLIPVGQLGRLLGVATLLAVCALSFRFFIFGGWMWMVVALPTVVLGYLLLGTVWKTDVRQMPVRTVLMVTQWLETGGLERMLLSLSVELQRGGDLRVLVLSYEKLPGANRAGLAELFEQRGIKVLDLQKAPGFSLRFLWHVLGLILKENVSVVHSHELGPLIYCGLAKILSPVRFRLVHTEHSLIHLQKFQRYRTYERWFSAVVDYLVAVSESLATQYRELLGPNRAVHVVENGIELRAQVEGDRTAVRKQLIDSISNAQIRTQLQKYSADEWVLYLGRLLPSKGQFRALEIWSKLHGSFHAHSVLIFVGPEHSVGMVEELRARAKLINAPERILCVGPTTVPHEWIAAADVYLSASEFEGLPLGPLEALAGTTPCLLSEIPGHELFRGRAEFFPLDKVGEGAQRLQKLLDLRHVDAKQSGAAEFRRELEKRAQWVRGRYSSERMAAEYREVYRKVLAA